MVSGSAQSDHRCRIAAAIAVLCFVFGPGQIDPIWGQGVGDLIVSPAKSSELAGDDRKADLEEISFDSFVRRQASLEVQIALQLYQTFDDYRAVTALKRYRILDGSPSADWLASLMIGQVYHRNDKATLAMVEFERAAQSAPGLDDAAFAYLMSVQEMCLNLSFYAACRQRIEALLEQEVLSAAVRDVARFHLLYNDVVLRLPTVDAGRVDTIQGERLRRRALGLIAADREFDVLSLQRPWLAGMLSGFVPGAGQVYNGRVFDGVASLVVTGLLGAGSYHAYASLDSLPLSLVGGLLTLGVYAGGIVNAVTDAKRMNAEIYRGFFEELKKKHWPRVQFSIVESNVSFGVEFDWPGPNLESASVEVKEEVDDAIEAAEEAPERRAPEVL
jgi:hypothetical protein